MCVGEGGTGWEWVKREQAVSGGRGNRMCVGEEGTGCVWVKGEQAVCG